MQISINDRGFGWTGFLNLELNHQNLLLLSIKLWKSIIGIKFPIWATLEYTYIHPWLDGQYYDVNTIVF